MSTALHPLSSCNTMQLQEIVNIIVKAVSPEHIFLLGAGFTRRQWYNIFSEQPATCAQVTHYDLLVLLPEEEKRSPDEVQDVIENRCRAHTPVTATIFFTEQFNDLLVESHPFCCEVFASALVVYDRERVPLHEPCYPLRVELEQHAKEAFAKWLGGAQEFFAGAELYLARKQLKMAAFMLHQVAERCYVGLIQVMTGYRAGTHNLDKLFRYARSFSAEICQLFPRNNEKEEQLFRQLQKAYIHSRYKDDYAVSEQELLTLKDRLAVMLDVVKRICEKRIASLGEATVAKAELLCIGRAV
jgi:uncharacterized protein